MRGLVAFALFPSLTLGSPLFGQARHAAPHALAAAAAANPDADAARSLHVTHVSLYKNGVGFFEHEGTVNGDATVRLDLTSAQLNDVLQTLTALDLGGGHITGANYNSTTPLDQQLRTLPLSLGEQPSQEDLFNSLRGARVDVLGSGASFTGRILALEIRPAAGLTNDGKPAPEHRFLTVISDAGATRTLELTPNTIVHLLDPNLRGDLNTYLQLLDSNRTEGIRHLVLTDHGNGSRVLHVSFLSEVPVWKSTYRLLLTTPTTGSTTGPNSTATLQGFSVIDNTTGEDWNNVQLSLIAGSPQSFLQPISQPIYDRRPEIPIAENAQTTPQTHESAEGKEPPPTPTVVPHAASGAPSEIDQALRTSARIPKNISMMKDTGAPPPPMAESMNVEAAPELYEQQALASTQANTTTSAFDDFFAYNLTDPVTIPRNGSALVPILQAKLPAESVTLWSAQAPHPLRALWITNNSEATLDRGSFSVVENGAFAGEGLIDPVHPGERRLLSYAADQAVRVSTVELANNSRVTGISVSKGMLHATQSEVTSTEYTVDNAAPATRPVVLETPRLPGWTLDFGTQPAETTPNAYRFRLEAQPHAAAHLTVTQRRALDQVFSLTNTSEEQLTVYLGNNAADPRILAQLEPTFAAKRKVADLTAQISSLRAKERSINDDQKRLRDNLTALKSSAEERSLVRRYTNELNSQEDALADIHRQIATLQDQQNAASANLSNLIASLQIAETNPTLSR